MTHSLRLVLFDLDGTVVDSFHNIHAAMSQGFMAQGLPAPTREAMQGVIGLSLPHAVAALLPEEPSERQDKAAASYKEAFFALRASPDFSEPLFPGALEALDVLEAKGFLLGVATGKSRRGTLAFFERYDLSRRFVSVQTADDCPGKPAPDMCLRAMGEVGVEPRLTVMVGDTTFDIEMAQAAHCGAVGVAWGNHAPDMLTAAGAHAVIEHFSALAPTVEVLTTGGERPCALEQSSN